MESENIKQIDVGGGRKGQGEEEVKIGAITRRHAVKAKESNAVATRGDSQVVAERGSCDDVSIVSLDSDADSRISECSVALEPLPSKFWKKAVHGKRRHDEYKSCASSEEDDQVSESRTLIAKRGRGRPSATGKYVGLAKAQSELNALRREEAQRKAEEEVAAQVASHKAKRVVAPTPVGIDSGLASELVKQAVEASEVILMVASKSGNLKGTFTKALKDSAASIKAAVEALYASSATEETAKLQADNARLRQEMAELRKELWELKANMAKSSERMDDEQLPSVNVNYSGSRTSQQEATTSSQQEELTRSIMLQVGGLINARLEAMEERLLPEKRIRPPLAADKRNEAAPLHQTVPESGKASSQPNKKNKKKKRQAAAKEAAASVQRQPRDLPPAPESMNEGWSTVTKKGKKKAKPTGKPASGGAKPSASTRPAQVRLRPPRTAAVVITLQPGAEEKGATYAKMLTEAKAKVDLASCGISSVRFRKAATGARILEVSAGDASIEKADNLAQKLRDALGEDLARVSRPTKCAEFRVLGLDDSVSKVDISNAVALRGGCLVEAVKVGEIKRTFEGTGMSLISCPVAAAKKIGDEGRLLVGWVSARVEMIQPRPLRCYRCLDIGHVRAQCVAETDRSEECYRCGQTGHKSSACSATPKCSVCAAANKPSAHRLGSKACAPPKSRRSRARKAAPTAATTPAATSCPSSSQTGNERVRMDTN